VSTGGEPTGPKPIAWLHGQITKPPFSKAAAVEAGYWLWLLQLGASPGMPHARRMPSIGPRCLELRINDEDATHRIICRVDTDAVLVGEVFTKKTRKTPDQVIENCKARFAEYDRVAEEAIKAAKKRGKPWTNRSVRPSKPPAGSSATSATSSA
jgi:phage-related protein